MLEYREGILLVKEIFPRNISKEYQQDFLTTEDVIPIIHL